MAPRGGGAKLGGPLPKLRILCPKTAFFFWPQTALKPSQNGETKGNGGYTPLHLDCFVTKSILLPSNHKIIGGLGGGYDFMHTP